LPEPAETAGVFITELSGGPPGRRLAVKDLFDTAGIRTTYGSAVFADHVPAESATWVTHLEEQGWVNVGKTNLHEFAYGVTSQNMHYGVVPNPSFPGRTAGGSSGGSAAAVVLGLADAALGTDTGGSIRIPATACGVVGLKTALGAVPTEGVFPLAASFDTVGPMARTVADCALAHAVLTGTEVPAPAIAGLRIGVLTAYPDLGPTEAPAARDERALVQVERLRALGADVRELSLPVPKSDTWAVFYADTAEAHAATFPSRRDEYGPLIRAKLDHAITVTAEEAGEGRRALAEWRALAAREPDVDLVLAPTLGYDELPPAGVDELGVRLPFSAYTRAFSYLGWPAIAIGEIQLAGRDGTIVLAAALALEREGGVR
jgi:aspartyl-tRNA(Asn)/glutamyl-tRNA(Gln) amidotransferase subunit A